MLDQLTFPFPHLRTRSQPLPDHQDPRSRKVCRGPMPVTAGLEFKKKLQSKHFPSFSLNFLSNQNARKTRSVIFLNRWDCWNQKEPHPSPTTNLQEAATALRIANIQAKLCWSKHSTNTTQGIFSWHFHIKRWTRWIKRKITFSESHYAATDFMVKLCENTFLRQTPTYVDTDNLLVVINKYSKCLPSKFLVQ